MDFDQEKLAYMLDFIYIDIEIYIGELLDNATTNSDYSAIYVENALKCYMVIEKYLSEELPFNIKTFFKFDGFTRQEYYAFKKILKKEAKSYNGIRY